MCFLGVVVQCRLNGSLLLETVCEALHGLQRGKFGRETFRKCCINQFYVSVLQIILKFCFFHFMFVSTRYEPEVLKFVRDHGEALGIDPDHPCTAEQAEWEGIANDTRLSFGNE